MDFYRVTTEKSKMKQITMKSPTFSQYVNYKTLTSTLILSENKLKQLLLLTLFNSQFYGNIYV